MRAFWQKKWVLIILLVAAGIAAYGNTLKNDLFWDDDDFIVNNQYLRDWQNFPKFFSENVIAGAGLYSNYWRPLLLIVFSLEKHLWGDSSAGFHAVNTGFHILCGILVFLLLQKLFSRRFLAFLVALFFVIHPIQTEAVSYANSLGDSLSTFFVLLGLFLFARALDHPRPMMRLGFYGAALCYALSLMAKETAIIFPGFALLVFLLRSPRQVREKFWQYISRSAKLLWPLAFVLVFYLGMRSSWLNFGRTFDLYPEENLFSSDIGVRILTFFRVLWLYVSLIFWPANLHMEREIPWATALSAPDVLAGLFVFLALAGLVVWRWRKNPGVSFGILWFLVALAPTSNILVPINGIAYEHWLYVPLVGFLIFIFGAITDWLAPLVYKSRLKNLLVIVIVALLAGCAIFTTSKRNLVWRDPIEFYKNILQYTPSSYRVINNLGMEYANRDNFAAAISTYRQAIDLLPQSPVAHHNLANAYMAIGRETESEQEYLQAISLDDKFLPSYQALLKYYQEKNRPAEAQALWDKLTGY